MSRGMTYTYLVTSINQMRYWSDTVAAHQRADRLLCEWADQFTGGHLVTQAFELIQRWYE